MPPDWSVVGLDRLEDIGLDRFPGRIYRDADLLGLGRVVEAFRGGVLVAVAFRIKLYRNPWVSRSA